MDRGTKTQFYLWTGQVINITENPVDKVKYEELGGRATVSEVLYCDLVYVTCFPGFHLVVQNVVQSGQSHRRQVVTVISDKFKDVDVVELAEFIEPLVEALLPIIWFPKVLGISSKAF